jgi:hypothetical protein
VELIQAYAPLAPHQRIELKSLLVSSRTPEAEMIKTWFELEREEGAKQGKEKGREEATETTMRTVIRRLLERKFGKLAPTVLEKLATVPTTSLDQLFDTAYGANGLAELGLE